MIFVYSTATPNIPKETVWAATAVFGRSNFYILVGDHLEGILEDLGQQDVAVEEASPRNVEDVSLPLITLFQFLEGLTDIQAIDAVRTRTDWKFALHLALMPAGLQENALCEFRRRILACVASQLDFQRLIDRLVVQVPTLTNRFQDLTSLDVVSTVCSLNRLHVAQQAMNQALEVLAVQYPQWLRKTALPHWYGRYNPTLPRLDVTILLGQQRFLMEEIASDIQQLLEKIDQSGLPGMSGLPEIKMLKQLWLQQFQALDHATSTRLETLSFKDCHLCFQKGRRYQI